jgi:DNA-binding response OmpR family regulator
MALPKKAAPVEGAPVVVLIEDEEDIRHLLLFTLREAGFETFAAAGAGEGLAMCALYQPDIVIIDRMLPGADGLDVLEQLRSDEEMSEVATLVLSARGSVDDRLTGFEAGADDYIVKPFSVADLVSRVQKLGAISRARKLLRESGPIPSP